MMSNLRNVARSLRARAPATEKLIWDLVRDRRLSGLKFRRQVPVGPYVVDFFCARHRLIVEADGPFHDAEEDRARDAWLGAHGFKVIHLPNAEVRERLIPEILKAITP
jgi:very-short-patch-repair endonuclease